MYVTKLIDNIEQKDILDELHRVCFKDDPLYETDHGYWWVAYRSDQPVAFAGLVTSVQWINTGYLCRCGVLPEHRGQGLQKKLLRARQRYAKRLGYKYLVTDTRENIPSSNNLISCGFKLYQPSSPWAFKDSLYWIKQL